MTMKVLYVKCARMHVPVHHARMVQTVKAMVISTTVFVGEDIMGETVIKYLLRNPAKITHVSMEGLVWYVFQFDIPESTKIV